MVKGSSNGKVKYIIFTDPENKKLTLKAGQEKQLGIKLTGDDKVTRKYTTSDKYVATIDKDGVVHAVGAGTCKITVVAGDQGGSIEVKVTGGSSSGSSSANKTDKQPEVPDVVGKKVETTGITIKASSTRVEAGKSIQLQVIFSPSNATGEEDCMECLPWQPVWLGGRQRCLYRHRVRLFHRAGNHRRREIQCDNAH